jgi:hypothetical protein
MGFSVVETYHTPLSSLESRRARRFPVRQRQRDERRERRVGIQRALIILFCRARLGVNLFRKATGVAGKREKLFNSKSSLARQTRSQIISPLTQEICDDAADVSRCSLESTEDSPPRQLCPFNRLSARN